MQAFSSLFFRGKFLLPAVTAAVSLLVRNPDLTAADVVNDDQSVRNSVHNQTLVATKVATHLLSNKYRHTNFVFSPLSIHAVLSVLASGSKDRTRNQLLAFLETDTTHAVNSLYSELMPMIFPNGISGGPRLIFQNGVWVDKTISLNPSFKQVMDTVYKASCKQVDFRTKAVEVANEVNLWTEKQTDGHIKQLIPIDAVNTLSKIIFVNAVYFKGTWVHKFKRSMTKESNFHLLDGTKVQVPFMTSEETQFVCEYDDFKVLSLPYSQGQDKTQFTMHVFLPNAKNGLQSLIQKIGTTSDFFDRHIPHRNVHVGQVLIPKFKISFGFEASVMLKELGLELPLSDEDGFGAMVDSSKGQIIYDLSIHHKSFVEVNEEGTEAAAATSVVLLGCPMTMDDAVDFVADHPFFFVIRENVTGAVLFIGQVVDPSIG